MEPIRRLVTRTLAKTTASNLLGWRALPAMAQVYAAATIVVGFFVLIRFFPTHYSEPLLFAALLVLSGLTSIWKVNLLLPSISASTLSVSYAAGLMALLLLGPHQAMVVATVGAWAQCTFNVKRPTPPYRTVFSMAAEAITMQATGLAYLWTGGSLAPQHFTDLPKPLVYAVTTYFLVNTGLVAVAIALSTGRRVWQVWHDNFLWSAPSFIVAGTAGAIAAIMVASGNHWLTLLMLAPVYLTYRSYLVFIGRIEDQQRHVEETLELHAETLAALAQARRAEQALTAEKERLGVTLRSIGDGVITTDLNETVVLLNKAAETLTGWTQNEAQGKPLSTVFRNFNRETRERCDNSLAGLSLNPDKLGVARCSTLVARDLSERPIEEIVAPLRDAVGHTTGMVVAFRDISDALKMQEERARADKLDSLGLLASGIAHDFNNILMAIMGNVSMARVTVPHAAPAAEALAEAEKACAHARQLTWQLLTFSKGGAPIKKTITLPRVLKTAASFALRGSNVSCAFHVDPHLWGVHADEGQLVQVFNNMLINAQQAMPHGGAIEVRAQNIIEAEPRCDYALRVEAGPYVRISITDNGIGIPEENLGSIFDPYFSTKRRGSGLGLATSYSIIKNHGGCVSVKSEVGRGTTVHVDLPASRGCEATDSAESITFIDAGRGGRILVMDDEASIRTLAGNMLKFLGYTVEVASDGTEALKRYKRALAMGRPFDAVLLDLIVPGGIGGKEVMERLSEIDPSVKAIVVSGYAQDPVITDFREHGFIAAIAKPFTLDELSRTLQSLNLTRTPAHQDAMNQFPHVDPNQLPKSFTVH
jgi:PAS domain S-box-containing protein